MSNLKVKWVLKHAEFENLYWGPAPDFLNGNDLIGWGDGPSTAQTIVSQFRPTYLNFVGSNSHSREMKKGVVVAI